MSWFKAFRDLIRKGALEPPIYGRGGYFSAGSFGGSGFRRGYPATNVDVRTESGQRYDNSVVLMGINWKWKRLVEAGLYLQTCEGDTAKEENWRNVKSGEAGWNLQAAFDQPAPDTPASMLMFGLSLSLTTRGTAYFLKRRDNLERVIGFRWVPGFLIRPRADKYNEDGTKLVTYYEYRPYGSAEYKEVFPEDVVVIKWGQNPDAPAEGLSELEAALKSICTVNELETMEWAMCKNAGMPSIILVPKEAAGQRQTSTTSGAVQPPGRIGRSERQDLAALYDEATKDMRGIPLAMPFPMDVHAPGFTPQEMILDKLAALPISIICGAMDIDPMVLHLPSESKKFANYAEARESAIEDCLMPLGKVVAGQLDGLIIEAKLDPARYRFMFAWQNIRALAPDKYKENEAARQDWEAGGLTLDEYRAKIGTNPDKSGKGDLYYFDLVELGLARSQGTATPKPTATTDEATPSAATDPQAEKPKRRAARKGVEVRLMSDEYIAGLIEKQRRLQAALRPELEEAQAHGDGDNDT